MTNSLVDRLREIESYDVNDYVDVRLGTLQVSKDLVDDLQQTAADAADRIEELEAALRNLFETDDNFDRYMRRFRDTAREEVEYT